MKIEAQQLEDVMLVALTGRLDSTNAAMADAEIMQAIGTSRNVVLDLASVNYVSSAGLRIVLLVAKRLGAQQGRLIVAGLSPNVHEVFEVSGFLRILKVAPDRDHAIAQLKA
jgi:anti-anti-sigma factor